jgi:hypothetical protein
MNNYILTGRVIGSLSSDDEEFCLLGYKTNQFAGSQLTFRRKISHPSSGMKKEISVKWIGSRAQQTTRHYVPEDVYNPLHSNRLVYWSNINMSSIECLDLRAMCVGLHEGMALCKESSIGYEARPTDISKTRDIGLPYPLICAGEIFLPVQHNEDTRASGCSVRPFPRENASWPEHYLSRVFFYASVNQRFKQPLSEFRSLLSKYVSCLHFLENQDYYLKVFIRHMFKKKRYPRNRPWGPIEL